MHNHEIRYLKIRDTKLNSTHIFYAMDITFFLFISRLQNSKLHEYKLLRKPVIFVIYRIIAKICYHCSGLKVSLCRQELSRATEHFLSCRCRLLAKNVWIYECGELLSTHRFVMFSTDNEQRNMIRERNSYWWKVFNGILLSLHKVFIWITSWVI